MMLTLVPDVVTQPIQYGLRFKSLLVYLNQQHLVPYDRLKSIISDGFGYSLSTDSLVDLVVHESPNVYVQFLMLMKQFHQQLYVNKEYALYL